MWKYVLLIDERNRAENVIKISKILFQGRIIELFVLG